MAMKAVALIAFCATWFAGAPSLAAEAAKKHPTHFTFILHPHLTPVGPIVDVRIAKWTYLAESTSVTCTEGRATAQVEYVGRDGTKISVFGQFAALTPNGNPQFEVKTWEYSRPDGLHVKCSVPDQPR